MKNTIRATILMILVAFSLFSVSLTIKIKYTNEITSETINSDAITANIGAWIIVGGDRSDHDKLEQIKWGCNKTYEILKSCGYTDAEIYYLFPDTDWATECPYADAYTTKANIQTAIQTWASTRVNSTRALGMYLFDHGGTGDMCVPGTDLTDADLNSYLDNLETSSGCNRMFIIYAACHAGSFINPISKDNRIVVTSTSSDLNSGSNPDKTWERFSETFWASIKNCATIGQAFEDAEANIHALGYGDAQKPWIDDNHDEIGHETDAAGNLPNGNDGNDALNTKLCFRFVCYLKPIYIEWIPLKWWISSDLKTVPIIARVQNLTAGAIPYKVFARIIPPWWQPPQPFSDEESTIFDGDEGVGLAELTDPDGDGNFTGSFNIYSYFQRLSIGFYKVNIYARSAEGDVAQIESTGFHVNSNGVPPADTTDPVVAIINPLASSAVEGTVTILAEGDDDTALEKIEIYIDGEYMNTTYMPDYYPYPGATYNWNTAVPIPGGTGENETHIILAKAYDKAGNTATHAISVNINPIPGFTITIVFIGCLLVVAASFLLKRKERDTLVI